LLPQTNFQFSTFNFQLKKVAKDITKDPVYRQWKERNLLLQSLTPPPPKESDEDKAKRISRARRDYGFFVKTYFPHLAKSDCAAFQIDAANYLKKNRDTRAVFEWARGHAKSTHLGVFIPLWLKIQQPCTFSTMILVSHSQEAADRLLADLQTELEFNKQYINDFGKQMKFGSWAAGEFATEDGCFFMSAGKGQIRGVKHNGNRPDYIVIDDIDDDTEVLNPKRVAKSTEWCLSALLGTMDAGKGRFVCVGNRIAKRSILTNLIERPGVYHTRVNILDRNGNPSWAEKNSPEQIAKLREYMGERNFQKEYMNNPITEGAVFTTKNINYGKMLPLTLYRQLVCYTDPSFKNTATSDYKATALVGKTPDGYFHVIKMFADVTSVSNMVAWHYEILDFIGGKVPTLYYIEANFMQDLFMDEFRKVGEMYGQHIPVIGDKRAKGDKFARIEAMQPLFERNMVVFNEAERDKKGFKILEEQLLMFERGGKAHDDAPDALESAIWMLAQRSRTSTAKYVVGHRTFSAKW
jgi:predicted phage terminase large subunit-like protein